MHARDGPNTRERTCEHMCLVMPPLTWVRWGRYKTGFPAAPMPMGKDLRHRVSMGAVGTPTVMQVPLTDTGVHVRTPCRPLGVWRSSEPLQPVVWHCIFLNNFRRLQWLCVDLGRWFLIIANVILVNAIMNASNSWFFNASSANKWMWSGMSPVEFRMGCRLSVVLDHCMYCV